MARRSFALFSRVAFTPEVDSLRGMKALAMAVAAINPNRMKDDEEA
jgi:hypothetical protein